MILEHDADCGVLYREKRRELMALARTLTVEQLRTEVPATPAWTVHDVLAHVVGLAADLNALRFPEGDAESWTAAQVAARRHATVADLAAEWEREGDQFEDGLRLFGYELGSHYVGDLLQHTQDVRAAVDASPLADDLALAVALDYYLDRFHRDLAAAAAGSVLVRADGEACTVGAGARVATMEGERFELFRCLGGRRSERQVRALRWDGNVDVVLAYVSAYPMPVNDVHDEHDKRGGV